MFRRTELERIDEELALAGGALEATEQAHLDLKRTLADLVQLDGELQELSRREREILGELARLTGGWYAMYNSVLGTSQDKHEVELAALARVQEARRHVDVCRAALQKRVEELLARTRTYDQCRARYELAVEAKERLLRGLDSPSGRRLRKVAEEEQQLAASVERIDRAIRSRQARGASSRELKVLRAVWREALARKAALAEERKAILLDGLSVGAWRAAS